MMSRSRTLSHCIQGLIFFVVFALCVAAVEMAQRLHKKNHTLSHEKLQREIAAQIESELTQAFAATHTLAQGIKITHGMISDFRHYAANMRAAYPTVGTFQVALLGRVSYKYPSIENGIEIGDQVLGNWLENLQQMPDRERHALVMTEPYRTSHDQLVISVWKPLYIKDGSKEIFWGFTSVSVRLEDVLSKIGITKLINPEVAYQVRDSGHPAEKHNVLLSHGEMQDARAAGAAIRLPGQQWRLQLSSNYTDLRWQMALAYLLCVLVAVFVAACFRISESTCARLSQIVANKNKELDHSIFRDNLTGLWNHRSFFHRLDRELTNMSEVDFPVTVALIDLDFFSEVNDAFGQQGGDRLLVEIAQRIRCTLPEQTFLARWGDDEFIVLAKNLSNVAVQAMIARIAQSINAPCAINGTHVEVTACIGVAFSEGANSCSNDVLSWAGQALASARLNGRNEIGWYSAEMRVRSQRRNKLLIDLQMAITRNELEVYYQPIVSSSSGAIKKAECLLRWNHATFGSVSPAEFIPLAEETGLMRSIGDWVFLQALQQVKKWRAHYVPDFCVSVNVSPVQLNRYGTSADWLQLMRGHGVPSSAILIEITEGVLLEKNTTAYAQLDELQGAGMALALDDFGTGYSSMSYLKVFDIDYIKIDRSFVMNLTESREDMILCDAIIAIADKMAIQVVAEGVETKEQRQYLIEAGSDYLQGFHFSKPLPARDFECAFLVSQSLVA